MKFVVTAGPTREHLDPVRFLSNPSTGKMGFAVARAAAMRGHEVALVAGPVSLKTPKGVRRIDVTSAREMLAAVEKELFANSRDMVRYSNGRVGDAPLPVGAALRADRISQCSMVFVSTAAVAEQRPFTHPLAHSPTPPLILLALPPRQTTSSRRRGASAARRTST